MGKAVDVEAWLARIVRWATSNEARRLRVVGVVVVGSHARGAASPGSDVDVVQSLRARYDDGPEIEWGITDRRWLETSPLDAPTADVVAKGIRVIHDPHGLVAQLAAAVAARG